MHETPQHKNHSIDRLALKILAVVLVVTALIFLWSRSQYHSSPQTPDTWLDQDGHLHVLGIVLDQSTLREAETALQSRSDTALYIYPVGSEKAGLKLESYFPSIADHTQVILRLAADDALLKAMESRASLPHEYPNKVLRMNLAPTDLPDVQRLRVIELTLVPSATITADMLAARFGQPDGRQQTGDTMKLQFNKVGLSATLDKDNPAMLHFTNPAQRRN
ncbi:MAG TPA: hypothetical protein VNI58_10910 [Mariprofundaceae bacterium]|nr:hypothetical protein [Mariprofundaceae bacterium]